MDTVIRVSPDVLSWKSLAQFLHLKEGEERLSVLQHLERTGQLQKIATHPAFSLHRLEEILRLFAASHRFYREMGGLEGYRDEILSLLQAPRVNPSWVFHAPSLLDITHENGRVHAAIQWGLEALPLMGEMIPLGGAADRLHLVDPLTGSEQPAAKLQFAGKTLLERLIADIQAREFLYFQKFGRQIVTPVALMTSLEKENHAQIEQLLEENQWFGRSRESYRIFSQPLVPVVDKDGNWLFSDDLRPVMKPGGHGALWKLSHDLGIFSWFESLGKRKLLIRQINNPMAGLDYGLLAFIGEGTHHEKKFGFASCPRLVHSAEGVNVLIEKEEGMRVLTNIEYCDFARFGIEDVPMEEGSIYSRFPSNTNLLFADIAALRQAVKKMPFPGLLLNLKKGSFLNRLGQRQEAIFGRLESTMQNIADVFEEKNGSTPNSTFITYNKRHKTISTTKKAYVEGGSVQETPEACFYDFLFAMRELLDSCGWTLPQSRTVQEMLLKGPEFVFLYHPALGPLYSDIARKLKKTSLALGSFVELEISDLAMDHVQIEGSLRIYATKLMGDSSSEGVLLYDDIVGKCVLRNVTICNAGVDFQKSRPFWKGQMQHQESVDIYLEGNATLIIENVLLKGSHKFEVFDGEVVRVFEEEGEVCVEHVIPNMRNNV